MSEKVKKLISMSDDMGDALGQFAALHNRSMNEVMVTAIAEYIMYDIETERRLAKKPGRPKQYKNSEDRKAAAKRRNRERRELGKVLLAHAEQQQRIFDANNIEASLLRRNAI